jgi:cytoskeleton protein RodZ
MSLDSFQDSLFEDPIGNRFRNSREKLRWSKESVAQQLKLPVSIIDAIEAENWSRLGAPIYIRSYVGSYARILGMPADIVDEVIRQQPTAAVPPLVHTGTASGVGNGRSFDRGVLKLGSVVMTGVIVGGVVMLAMHLQSRNPVADIVPLDPPATAGAAASANPAPAATTTAPVAAQTTATPTEPAPAAQAPVMASLAPSLPAEAQAARPDDLVLNFRAESWVDVVNAAGQHIERGLLPAGTQRRYARGEIQRVTVGNAEAVEAVQGGQTVDLTPFREANVARFAVSSEGKVVDTGD